MTKERAIEINNACCAHAWYREGLREELPPTLEGISLEDMLEATKIVEGLTPRQMVCDQRLLAALYVAYNYHADDQDNIDPVAMSMDGKAVCVVKIGRGENG